MPAPRRLQPEKPGDPTYRQIWRVVDGAVKAAFDAHPEFVAPSKRLRTVRNSITKRVTGAIHGYAGQSAWVRSGPSPADDKTMALTPPLPETGRDPVSGSKRDALGRREGAATPPASAAGAAR